MLNKLFRRRPLIEELEPRILYSADLAPLALDGLQPAPEQRVINADGEFSSESVTTRNELVIVDTSVENYQTLLDDILKQSGDNRHIEVVVLDASRDGIQQISDALRQHGNLDALHLITHGDTGLLKIGNSQLDAAALDVRAAEVSAWGAALTADADLLLYGCDVAVGAGGEAFVNSLANLTGTDVAASTNKTGSTLSGGDWVLEFETGALDTASIIGPGSQQVWTGILAITQGNTSTAAAPDTGANTLTWSHTVASGADGLLVVEVTGPANGPISSITYGGVNLTKLASVNAPGAKATTELWYLKAPAAGTADIVVDVGLTPKVIVAGATNFYGVNQTTPFGTAVTASGTGGTPTVTVASAVGEKVIDVAGVYQGTSTTVGASQSSLWTNQISTAIFGASSIENGAASVTMSWNTPFSSPNGEWSAIAVAIRPSASSTLTVDTANDVSDGDTSSISALLASRGTDNSISLREAIIAANNTAGLDQISFSIGSGQQTINLASALPTITGALILDGTTQGGYAGAPLIALNGSGVGSGASGLVLGAGSNGSTIKGVAITSFKTNGIEVLSNNNIILGNYLGLMLDGMSAAGNDGSGIYMTGINNTVGGPAASDRNVIAANKKSGIEVSASTGPNLVEGNLIGLATDGTTLRGNLISGIQLKNSASYTTLLRNTLGGHTVGSGIEVNGPSVGTVIRGNYIGTNAGGAVFANNIGISVLAGATQTTIGGINPGEGNTIANNLASGVAVSDSATIQNSILGNVIHSNGSLGIDLENNLVSANDVGDADTGANNLQNYPVLSSAATNGVQVTVTGTLNSTANCHYRIEFFANTTSDPSNHGEGRRYLGFANVATDASGNASINATLLATVTAGEYLSATATLSEATYITFTDTSEFAQNVIATSTNTAPVITSGSGSTANVSINENMTEATTVTATDVDLPAQTLSYSIVPVGSGGAVDAAKFTISAAGVLSFIVPPDYETPTDADLNNVYDVTVQVSDGNGGIVTQVIAVTVNDLGGPLTVDTTADTVDGNTTSIEALLGDRGTDGLISLREAILAANATAGADIINLPDGTFTLTLAGNDATALLGDLDITDALTLRGTGSASTIIDATGLGDRLLEIFGVAVTVEDLTLRGGNAGGGGALYVDAGSTVNFNRVRIDNNSGASGGAIYNFNSTLNLTDSTLAGNKSTGFGGSIYNDRGTLTLTRSTVSGNTAASDGGGLYSFGNGATLTLLNTTVSGNTAGSDGGGISSNKPVIITSSTIAYNTAAATGGGIHIVNPGSATLLNTIVANNTSSNTALSGNSNAAVTSLGGNIDSGNTLGLAQPGDQINTDPLLGALQDNGGYTFTHALLAGSPAINLAIAGGPATDQRGVTRDATPDIGAYEYVYTGNVAPAISISATPLNFTEGDLPVLLDTGASVNDPDSANFDGGSLTVQFSSGGTADDRLSIRSEGMGAGQIGIAGATLYYGGVLIGSFSGGTDGATPLVVLFNASADLASVQATLRNVSFNNASQMPSAISRNVTVQLTDGDGGVSNLAGRVIAVTAVNDPPVNTVPGAQTTAKNTTLVFSSANGNALSIADVDANSATVETTLTVTSGVLNAVAGTTGVTVTGSGAASVVLSGTLAQINTLLAGNLGGSLSYTPTTGFTGSANLQMVTNDLGSSGSGGAQTDSDVVSISVTDASLWLSTDGTATSSAGSGNLSWADGQVVNFGNPNLALGSVTTGTFSSAINLDALAGDGNVDIKGLHYVSQDTIVGTLNPISLLAGDVLFSVDGNETFGGLAVTKQDIVLFRPSTPGDYSSGSFQIVLRDPGGTNNDIRDFALVERALTVGGTSLQAGDFLLVLSSGSYDKDISHFSPTDMATPSTSGSLSLLIKGDSAGINNGSDQIWGLELVQQPTTLGGQALAAGTLLLSLDGPALVGTNGLSAQEGDVFALTVTATGAAASATASMLLESADVGLSGGSERFDALALVQRASAAPVVAIDASVLAYIENDLTTVIAPAATVTDADSSTFGGGSLSVYLSSNGTLNDRLAIRNEGTGATQIGISGSDVTYSGVIIGSFSGGEDGATPLVISLNANATLAATQALLRNITYANVSDDPSTLPRTASVVLTDGSGGVSNTVSRTISVTAANDAPTISGVTASTAIDDTGTATPFSGVVISDVDSPAQTQTVTITLDLAAKGSLSNLGGGSYNAGTGVYSFSGTAAAATTAVQGLVFTPTANRVAPGSTETTTFTISVNDGVAPAVTDSTTTVVTTSINDAPTAVVDTAAAGEAGGVANGTAGTNPSGNVLTNDTDVDSGDTQTVTAVSFGVTPGVVGLGLAGAYGTLTLNADGSYSYAVDNSNATVQALRSSDSLTETFDYALQDMAGALGSGTLTITITGSNDAPVITSSGTQVVVEESPATVSTTATDVESDTLAFSITGGADAAWFTIDSSTGLLSLTFVPDYETPKDANLDNLYEVIVTVNDGNGGTHTLAVQLVVADKVESVAAAPAAPPAPDVPAKLPAEVTPEKEVNAEEAKALAPLAALNESVPKAATAAEISNASVTIVYQSATATAPAQMMMNDVQLNRNNAPTSLTLVTLNQLLGGLSSDGRALQLLQNSLGNGNFLQQLDQLQDTIRQQLNLDKNVVASTLAVSTGLSVGYVLWLVRGGVLLSSLLTSLPAWRLIDPLPILGHLSKRDADTDPDDDSLEGMLNKSNRGIAPVPSDPNEVTP